VVKNTVTPSSRASLLTSAQSALRLCGSRPVVGSSRKSIRGLLEPDALQKLLPAPLALFTREPVQRGLQVKVLASRQEGVERRLL
jgi:hypothetical protein